MPAWLIVLDGIVVWLVMVGFVVALGAAAKRGDEDLGYEPRDEWRDGV